MGISKKQLMELEMSAKNKNFFNGAFKGIFITALSFSLFTSLAANAADLLRHIDFLLVRFKLRTLRAVVIGAQVRLGSRRVRHGVNSFRA